MIWRFNKQLFYWSSREGLTGNGIVSSVLKILLDRYILFNIKVHVWKWPKNAVAPYFKNLIKRVILLKVTWNISKCPVTTPFWVVPSKHFSLQLHCQFFCNYGKFKGAETANSICLILVVKRWNYVKSAVISRMRIFMHS